MRNEPQYPTMGNGVCSTQRQSINIRAVIKSLSLGRAGSRAPRGMGRTTRRTLHYDASVVARLTGHRSWSCGLRKQDGPLQDDHEVPQRVGREREPQLTARLLVQACRVRVRVGAGVRVRVSVRVRVRAGVRVGVRDRVTY